MLADYMGSMFEVEDFVRLMVGEAMRGEATARSVGLDLFSSFQASLEEWIANHCPSSPRGRVPPRWPGSSAPWWSGSSSGMRPV